MKRCLVGFLLLIMAVCSSGCMDRHDLEDLTIILILGIDLDENNNLVFYESSPVFSRDAKDKEEEFGVKAMSVREARMTFDGRVTALSVGGQVEVVLLGKRLLQHKDWFRVLDLFYRDSKMSVTPKVIAVDGKVSDVIYFMPKDKPRLPVMLSKLVDSGTDRGITVKTSVQELFRQMTDKGVTPAISLIHFNDGVNLRGSALLDEQGKYAESLTLEESVLLQILQGKKKDMSLTLMLPAGRKNGPIKLDKASIAVQNVSVITKQAYRNGRFQFDLKVNLALSLAERLFPYDMGKESSQLEKMIDAELQKKLDALLVKMRRRKLDPLGLGDYARAYQYREWKQVKDKWGETLANGDIHVTVQSKLKNTGAVK